jgi:hypothetical protein
MVRDDQYPESTNICAFVLGGYTDGARENNNMPEGIHVYRFEIDMSGPDA